MSRRRSLEEFQYSRNVSRNFDRHQQVFFLWRLRTTDFLSYVIEVTGFDRDTRTRIKQLNLDKRTEEANKLFLETFRKSDSPGKWLRFIEALENLGYTFLVSLLTGEPVTTHVERYEKFLELLTPVVIAKINPMDLVDNMVNEAYLDRRDYQAIKCRTEQEGEIAGTELLLSCISRLKSDWYHGFMAALKKANMTGVAQEVDAYFEMFLRGEQGVGQGADLTASFSALTLEDNTGNDLTDSLEELPDGNAGQSPQAERGDSPTLCEPKCLTLRDFQQELYQSANTDRNTLILCPVKSGKRFVALQLIKDHLSLGCQPDGKVAYLVTKTAAADKVARRCKVFLSGLPLLQLSSMVTPRQSSDHLASEIQNAGVLIGKAKFFHSALEQDCINVSDFTLWILELTADYYEKEGHVYKEIMKFYHELKKHPNKAQPLPKIVVLTTSICGLSPLEELFCTAMETCAEFDIQTTAMVQKPVTSLRKEVVMPLVERTPVSKPSNDDFIQQLEYLMSRVESVMQEVYHSKPPPADHVDRRMLELTCPPTNRMSVKYMAWLKTNIATLGYADKRKRCPHAGIFATFLRLAKIYQHGLFVNAECNRLEALLHMRKSVERLTGEINSRQNSSLNGLVNEFKGLDRRLKRLCHERNENPVVNSIENKLRCLFQQKPGSRAVVLLKHSVAVLPMKMCLARALKETRIRVECVLTHQQDYVDATKRLSDSRFNVLITTWPILAFHLGKKLTDWDCVIRTDCLENEVLTWQHQARVDMPQASQFRYPDENTDFGVDLLLESTTEEVMLSIAKLQQDAAEEYQAAIRDTRCAKEEWEHHVELCSSLKKPYDLDTGNFFCNGCGTFVCNKSYIRNLDVLWLGLHPHIMHRLRTIKHPDQIRFCDGYAKLGRFVCKRCGQKWGIIAYVLGTYHLAFAKEGLEFLDDGHYHEYNWKWKYAGIEVDMFNYGRDLRRCLPETFCVDGKTIKDLSKLLREPVDED